MIDLTISEFLQRIPGYIIEIAEKLEENNYEAYLVGGSIRDILLGKTPNDFDIATNANPDEIVEIFTKSVPTGAQFGTITVLAEDDQEERHEVEVTTYRSEEDYVGGRWPAKVEYAKTVEEDLSRRDFTINAMALDLQRFDEKNTSTQQILIDPFYGITDLKNKKIKAVRDPLERFEEDGIRAVRGCRLAAQLNFEIDENTFEAMRQTNHVTKKISVERFREELMKLLLKSPKPSKGLRLMKDAGILGLFIPELLDGQGIEQPRYHVDDVFEHTLKVVDAAEDSVKLTALLHDVAKPITISTDDGGVHFYGHDVKGAELAKKIMKRLKFSNAEIDRVSRLIRWHMFYYPTADWRREAKERKVEKGQYPSHFDEEQRRVLEQEKDEGRKAPGGWSDGAIRRLIKNVGGEDNMDDLMKLRVADADANPKSEFSPKELDALSERISEVRAKEMALKVTDLDISGKDLMENFGLKPGKVIGDVLNYLLNEVIEDPALNKKIDLLRLAKVYLESN